MSEEDPQNNQPNSVALALGATVLIAECVFRDGFAVSGGAALVGTVTYLNFLSSEVSHCRATQGGAVAVIQSPRPLLFVQRSFEFSGVQLHDNSAETMGGSIVLRSVIAPLSIETSHIWNTQAELGGAIWIHGGLIVTIYSLTIENAFAAAEGGQFACLRRR